MSLGQSVIDKSAFDSFVRHLEKIAALDEKEQVLYKKIVEMQRQFDQRAGKLTLEEQEAHRANTARLEHFLKKKKDPTSTHEIPGWAKDPKGKVPEGGYNVPGGSAARRSGTSAESTHASTGRSTGPDRSPRPSSSHGPNAYGYEPPDWDDIWRKVKEQTRARWEAEHADWVKKNPLKAKARSLIVKHPYASAALAGGAVGAGLGELGDRTMTPAMRKQDRANAKREGKASEWAVAHPKTLGAAVGASEIMGAVPLLKSIHSPRGSDARTYAALMGGILAPGLAIHAGNKIWGKSPVKRRPKSEHVETQAEKDEHNRKRREEYAREKPMRVAKPRSGAPAVSKPKKAA